MRILHVFRTPVGGLFRHVRDVARGQAAAGHEVGILCDSTTGGDTATRLLDTAAPHCSLGVKRIPISRMPGFGDLSGIVQTRAHARQIDPDIIHCHGAKGGLYGRAAGRLLGLPSVYTPHGGSLHYSWASLAGAAFLGAEWLLARAGSGLHFVCDYEKRAFDDKIGIAGKPARVVYNGLWPEEFDIAQADADAADLLFIGDMRLLKGVDILLEAMAVLSGERKISACLVGDGPDLERFKAQARSLGLADVVNFAGRMPAAEAFHKGRVLVMPSRAESFPYVVLEACAAGVPLLASAVGGIPEVLGPACLFPAGEPQALAARLKVALADPERLKAAAAAVRKHLASDFTADRMVNGILSLYRDLRPA